MPSYTTRPSLLQRVRDRNDQPAWRDFESLYGELILRYCRHHGLQLAQAEDVRQIALLNLSRALPSFEYDPTRGKFRSYVGRVVRSAMQRQRQRHESREWQLDKVEDLPVSAESELDRQWEQEWTAHHARRALLRVRATFDARSVAVFDRLLAGESIGEVAVRFELTPEGVRKIKQRVRERLTTLIREQIAAEERGHEKGP